MGEFGFAVSRFASQTKEKEKLVIRKIAIGVYKGLILNTPVDEGTARGNWQASITTPKEGVLDRKDKSGSQAIAAMVQSVSHWVPVDERPAYLTNNLPYIQRLNEGWSKQAPAHFVEQVVSDYLGIVEASV